MARHDPDKHGVERELEMSRLYRSGKTLQEIGDLFSLTRERVRQLIKKHGLNGKSGGKHRLAIDAEKKRQAVLQSRRDARSLLYYGCTKSDLLRLNEGIPAREPLSAAGKYRQQKNNAIARSVGWAITFPQWMALWLESGHWDDRGCTRDAYVMARKGDTGPYAIGNVYITTLGANVSDYQASLKVRGVECADGFRRLPEKRHRVSTRVEYAKKAGTGRGWTFVKKCKKNPYQVVCRDRYIGCFPTRAAAEAAYKVAAESVKNASS